MMDPLLQLLHGCHNWYHFVVDFVVVDFGVVVVVVVVVVHPAARSVHNNICRYHLR